MGKPLQADLARLYHLHSSNTRAVLPDLAPNPDERVTRLRTYPGSTRVGLAGRDLSLKATLEQVLVARSSVREFALDRMPRETLGRLLHGSYGVLGTRHTDGEWLYKRPVPSAGALYPLELYLACQQVEGIADGIYHYDARAHELELRRLGRFHTDIAGMTLGQHMTEQANIVVLVAGVPARTMWKYGQRGYRYLWLDAGHMAQNLCLVAVALGLGAVPIGGFFDQEVNELVGVAPPDEEVIYMLCVGSQKLAPSG